MRDILIKIVVSGSMSGLKLSRDKKSICTFTSNTITTVLKYQDNFISLVANIERTIVIIPLVISEKLKDSEWLASLLPFISHQNNFLQKNLLVFFFSRDYLHFKPVKWNLCSLGKLLQA